MERTFSADEFDRELQAVSELLDAAQRDVTRLDSVDERARALRSERPSNPLARNLVGLVDFARGRYAMAYELFVSLARRNADVVSLRVNAGISALCAGELEAAHDNLRRAVDLDSGHRRAYAYLAVVHLVGGQRDLARAALLEAGFSELAQALGDGDIQPVERAARALADRIGPGAEGVTAPRAWEGFAELGALEGATRARGIAPEGVAAEGVAAEAVAEDLEDDLEAAFGALQRESTGELAMDSVEAAAAAAEFAPDADRDDSGSDHRDDRDDSDDDIDRIVDGFVDGFIEHGGTADGWREGSEPVAAHAPPPAVARAARPIIPTVAHPGRRPTCFEHLPELALAAGDVAEVDGATLRFTVDDRARFDHVFVRQDLLVATRGEVRFTQALTRRKGAHHEPFVVGKQPIWCVSGAAQHLLTAPRGHHFELIRIVDESVYLAESCLAAYSAGLRWENGRIPGSPASSDGIVELSGRGVVVVHTRGELTRLAVGAAPVEVRAESLIGWAGETVPSATSVSATPSPHVECRGAGVLMLCAEPARN